MADKKKFFAFARSNRVGRLLLEQIRPLHIQLKETRLEQIEKWIEQEHLLLDRGDIIQAARTMDKLGIARFVVGRRGAPSRIEWALDTSDLDVDAHTPKPQSEGDEAQGAVGTEEAGRERQVVGLASEASHPSALQEPGAVIEHSFRVRADFPITFQLPADFSSAEAERLCSFIKALPF